MATGALLAMIATRGTSTSVSVSWRRRVGDEGGPYGTSGVKAKDDSRAMNAAIL